jgi:DNA-binding MarR family transcriptional regulator
VLLKLGLTYPQYLVMMVLWEWDDDGDNAHPVGVLGSRLYLDSGTLTPLLKRLQERGLVHRDRSSEDERVVLVGVTQRGRELAAHAESVPEEMACMFPDEDIGQISNLRFGVRRIVEILAQGTVKTF